MPAHDPPSELTRLLKALDRPTLLRLCRVSGVRAVQGPARKTQLVEALEFAPRLDAGELVDTVLRKPELTLACQGLNLPRQGTREQLARRIARALRWRPFADARRFARGLGLRTVKEWRAYGHGELADSSRERPADIPLSPCAVYRENGWAGYGDWLGTGAIANSKRVFWPYAKGKRFAQGLELSGRNDWRAWVCGELPHLPAAPAQLPHNPPVAYADDWETWGAWLGTGTVSTSLREFLPYAEARRVSRAQGFRLRRDWLEWQRGQRPGRADCPADMPAHPWVVYELSGWKGWEDFLGRAYVSNFRTFRPFAEARRLARSLGFASESEYQAWWRAGRPDLPRVPRDVPSDPRGVYKGDWLGWGDFLGTGTVAHQNRTFRPFPEAREFARGLGFPSVAEWRAWSKGQRPNRAPRPADIPAVPASTYADDWESWGDWLGTGHVSVRKRSFLPFAQARAFARSLGLRTSTHWQEWCAGRLPVGQPRPDDVPSHPERAYRQVWAGWKDWLGSKPRLDRPG